MPRQIAKLATRRDQVHGRSRCRVANAPVIGLIFSRAAFSLLLQCCFLSVSWVFILVISAPVIYVFTYYDFIGEFVYVFLR